MKGRDLIKLLSRYEDEEICIRIEDDDIDKYFAIDWVVDDSEDGVLIIGKPE